MDAFVLCLRIIRVIMLVVGITVGVLGVVLLVMKLCKKRFQANKKIIFISIVMIIYGVGSVLAATFLINHYIYDVAPLM